MSAGDPLRDAWAPRLARDVSLAAPEEADSRQQAWLDALRKRVPGASLRRWLDEAARLARLSMRRDSARRREREQRAARSETERGTLERVLEREVTQRLRRAVEALEEPYRSAILLRYYEDLPPREISSRLGIPVNTARSRVRRGLETLRERLESESLLGLLPLLWRDAPRVTAPRPPRQAAEIGRTGPAWLAGWPLPGALTLLLGLGALCALGVALEIGRGDRGREPGPGNGTGLALERGRVAEAGAAPDVSPSSPGARSRVSGRGPAGAGVAEPGRSPLVELRGRVRLEGAGPAAGLTVELRPEASTGDLADFPGTWSALTHTDSNGDFVLSFEPPSGALLGLELHVPGHVPAAWVWGRLEPGERIDLGEVLLPLGGVVEGRLLDARGRPLCAAGRTDEDLAWSLVAELPDPEPAPGSDRGARDAAARDRNRRPPTVVAKIDPGSSTYRIEDAPPGELQLVLGGLLVDPVAGPRLRVLPGDLVRADFVYSGPDPARRLVVALRATRPWTLRRPAIAAVRLLGPDGAPLSPARDGSPFALVFDRLEPGPHELIVEDPDYLPSRTAGLRPGTRVELVLEGSAGLLLDVRDRSSGRPLESVRVLAALERGGRSRQLELHHGPLRGPGTPPGGRLTGLLPGSYLLTLEAADHAPERVRVDDLAPGELRRLEVGLRTAEPPGDERR